ncbi:head closure Hc1 [Streptomyces phage Rowa]|uniref:Head-to-tail connector complex protein n=1 Tax=Streptomyces phage Rowa TaxID=2059883 RepID=A0A2H5BLV9_9CAUD|nr:head closure Hc1 [Streptomyces phage Rowa]AUG87274.1 head-to-tail connector complex protein [Streptomyces phage Rowa]
MSRLHGETVTLVRAPLKVDKYGNATSERDWAAATRTVYPGLMVQPDASNEATGDRPSVVTGWRLITPKGRDFPALPTDRVEWDGLTLAVDGEVGRFKVAGRLHHVEARLKRVSG